METFIKGVYKSMHWWDALIAIGVIAVQLVAWFATDGVAIIATLALVASAVYSFVKDVEGCIRECGKVDTPPVPGPNDYGEHNIGDTLVMSRVMTKHEKLISDNGKYGFYFQADGNLGVYDNGGCVWAAGTYHRDGKALVMQEDGNLVLYKHDRKDPVWNTATYGNGEGCRLVMQNDRNLVVYNDSNQPLWATNTNI